MDKGLKIAVVEDHDLMLDGLVAGLSASPDISVTATANSVESLKALLPGLDVDVVLTDLQLGDGSGKEVAELTQSVLGVPVLMITGFGDPEGVTAAVSSGCAGFVSKGASPEHLAAAIRTVAAGGTTFPASLLRMVLTQVPNNVGSTITAREREVLELLARGQASTEIAEELFVSIHTVRNHIRSLLTKLEAKSQLQAVVIAARAGLVEIG